MPAAVVVPAIMGAAGIGANLFGASKAAGAAKSAAQQQQAATQQAQQFNQQAFQRQSDALSPYQQAGTHALNNLMQTYGSQTPQDFAARSAGFVNSARMNPYGQPFQQGQTASLANPGMQQPGGGGMQERGPEQPQAGAFGPAMGGIANAAAQLAPQAQGGGRMVTVQDDTGASRQVPAQMAQQYQQRGFKVLG